MFYYDIQGKKELDREISPLIKNHYTRFGKDPVTIKVSTSKMRQIERVFPSQNKSIISFNGITIEEDAGQTEDFHLVAE